MNDTKMTAEQRYWYLKGYIDCFIPDLAKSQNITDDEARKMLGNMLARVIKVKEGV